MTQPTPSEIGAAIRRVRRKRDLSQETVAGLAGITRPYLSLLENGRRAFEKRGLLESIAQALSCSVTDLTGQPYPARSRDTVQALALIPPLSTAFVEATFEDVPEIPARPVPILARRVRAANDASADSKYAIAGHDLADLIVELHVHALTGNTESRRAALAALTEACIVALGMARNFGNLDLAVTAGPRAMKAAAMLESPALGGFAAMSTAVVYNRIGARRRATQVIDDALAALSGADPDAEHTAPAEAAGMLHLARAQQAAKDQDVSTASTHLREARLLAARTGERKTLNYDFGLRNVLAWDLSQAVELGNGTARAEQITRRADYEAGLASADRLSALHFDLARGFLQAGGDRDAKALQHLDRADQVAPQRIRHDPIAREMLAVLESRDLRNPWELRSLKARFHEG